MFSLNPKKTFYTTDKPTERQREVASLLLKELIAYRIKPDISRPGAIPRSTIDINKLTDQDLLDAGFKKSYIAVPETGQSQLVTYRHPRNSLHFHKHPNNWLFHEDKHPALSMVLERYRQDNPNATFLDKTKFALTKALPESASHIIHEGLPGWVNWGANTLSGDMGFNSPQTDTNYKELAKRVGIGALGLSATEFALSGGSRKLETLPGNIVGLTSLVASQKLATKLYEKLSAKNDEYKRPGMRATAILAGIPIVSAIAGKIGTDAVVKHLFKQGHKSNA